MKLLKNIKRMIATVLSAATCLTPGLIVSADGGQDRIITIQRGSSQTKKLPLVYNDDYFDKSAFEYNESLATASLALELSGFADTSNYSDQAKNAKQALKQLDFGDIEENSDYKRKSETDTIGVVAANKKIKSNEEEYTLIPVVIRGGGYENEWSGNAKVGKSGDHEGFSIAAQKAKDFVDNYIKNKNIQGKVKLWIVGYSRGGATAGLLGVKFNNEFSPILDKLNKEFKNSTNNEEYYNSYVNKEKERTKQKYGKEIEINPNDLYVYTFEAPMGMNILNGSGLKEYQGNIPCSKSEKNARKIYSNIHNTINDDDLVTKVAPKDWGFARPGVDHKLLEGRRDSDIKNMESILNGFLVNTVDPGSVKYVGNKSIGGYNNYSEFGNRFVSTLNKAMDRVRSWNNTTINMKNMKNREFYSSIYQKTISKLVLSIMADRYKFEKAKQDILDNCKWSLRFMVVGALNTNYLDTPFNNIADRFSKNVDVKFSQEERKALIDLLKGLNQWTEIRFLWNAFFNVSEIMKMHVPEVHLATLISKDPNKPKYLDQMQKINSDYAKEHKIMQDKKNNEAVDNDELVDELGNINLEKLKEEMQKEEEKKKGKEEKKDEDFENIDQIEEEKKDEDDFVNLECSKNGIDRAIEFDKQQQKIKEANAKGIVGKTIGFVDKGIKTGLRLATSPIDETKNIFGATKDFAGHLLSGLSKWWK